MTCREKLAIEHPSCVGSIFVGGCCGCPHSYDYLPKSDYCRMGIMDACIKCWDREIPETETTEVDRDMLSEVVRNIEAMVVESGIEYKMSYDPEKRQFALILGKEG